MPPGEACILHSSYVHRRMTGSLRSGDEQNSSHAESPLKGKMEFSEIHHLTWEISLHPLRGETFLFHEPVVSGSSGT